MLRANDIVHKYNACAGWQTNYMVIILPSERDLLVFSSLLKIALKVGIPLLEL